MSEPIPSAVLGASGYIGQEFVRLLSDHPGFAPTMLVAGDRSAGRRLEDVWRLAEEVPRELAGVRLVAAADRAAKLEIATAGPQFAVQRAAGKLIEPPIRGHDRISIAAPQAG